MGKISKLVERVRSGKSRKSRRAKVADDFKGSQDYWVNRYEVGKNSGPGSYNQLAAFKAEILNGFVEEESISSVIEFGCGDGNQLSLARYPRYTGYDISPVAISTCTERFAQDASKQFKLMDTYTQETAELVLSLDVIYHLVEDPVFEDYMNRLFAAATRFVIIYSSDKAHNEEQAPHVRHRQFSQWIKTNIPQWELYRHIPNKYPFKGDTKTGSFADFYIYKRSE